MGVAGRRQLDRLQPGQNIWCVWRATRCWRWASKNTNRGDTNGMRLARAAFFGVVWFGAMCALCGPETAHGDLQWHAPTKEFVRLRLLALSWNHTPSSFLANEEIFIAEKELTKD